MKLIGATISRTGTISLKVALERLGYRTYHFEEAIGQYERGDLDRLDDHINGVGKIDWKEYLEGYDATADLPMAWYYREIMDAFPEAKVILTVRDPDKWYSSFKALIEQHDITVAPFTFLPRFDALMRTVADAVRELYGGADDAQGRMARFEEYMEGVKDHVPADRLLVFSVKDGWEPLCDFLGEPLPDEPFPHENVGMKLIEEIHIRHLMNDLQAAASTSDDPEIRQRAQGALEMLAQQGPPPG